MFCYGYKEEIVCRRKNCHYSGWFERASDKRNLSEYGISDVQYYKWRDEALEGMKKV